MNDRNSPFVPRDGIYPEETGGRVPKRLPQKVEQIPKKRIFADPSVVVAPPAAETRLRQDPRAEAPVARPVFKTERPGSTQPPVNQRLPVQQVPPRPRQRPPQEEYPRKTSFSWAKRPYDYKRALEQLKDRGYAAPTPIPRKPGETHQRFKDAGVSLLGIINRQIHENFEGSVPEKMAAAAAFIRNYKLSTGQQPDPGYELGPDHSTWINKETQDVHRPSEDQIDQAWKATEEELFDLRASGELGQANSQMSPEDSMTLKNQVELNALEKKLAEMERLSSSRGVSRERTKLYTDILDLKAEMGRRQ